MIAVTGANGHLGQLVIEGLVERVPVNQIIAAVRSPEKGSSLGALGVQVREADYSRPETLSTALHGVKRSCSFRRPKSIRDSSCTKQ